MGMYQNIQDILKVLWYDEELLRLLYYSPENKATETLDPLDPKLENILDKDELEQWSIRQSLIKMTPKENDLTEMKSCKLFVFLGDGYATRGNPLYANQTVVFDVYVPSDYENADMRSARIGDKLNSLFALEYVTGGFKMDFVKRRAMQRFPNDFVGYRYEYDFVEFKK